MNAPQGDGQRVSQVKGDRMCTRCGFNLIGQTVLREPVYSMLIVRCPECGAASGVEEYPALGRWANRWAAVLAAVWALLMLAGLAGTTGMLAGMSVGASETMQMGIATKIGELADQYEKANPDPARPARQAWMTGPGTVPGAYSWVDYAWWQQQDPRGFFRAAGGWRGMIHRETVAVWGVEFLGAGVVGVIWAVSLLGVKRWRVLALLLVPLAIAGTLGWLIEYAAQRPLPNFSGYLQARFAAERVVGPIGYFLTLGLLLPGLWAGALAGRPLVRWLVRAMLPPSVASALSVLWTAEGLDPPRPAYATTARSSSQKESAARATDLGQAGSKASKA